MPRNRKLFIHGLPYEITFRTESGLPFPAQPLIKYAMESILARAQTYYPVGITAVVLMSNHYHMVVVVDDPASIPPFVGFIKRESAHLANHLLGRRRHTVWLEGYDSVPILDFEKMIDRLAYIYTNPAKANLEEISRYPHVSSWKALLTGAETLVRKAIPRALYLKQPSNQLSLEDQNTVLESVIDECTADYALRIDTDLWLSSFEETKNLKPEVIRKKLLDRIEEVESGLRLSRERPLKGEHALRLESIKADYLSQKHGKKMICFSSVVELRKRFIKWFKYCSEQAGLVYQRWKSGDYAALFPPGFFLPGGALASNVNPNLWQF